MPLLFGHPGERLPGISLLARCASRRFNCAANHLSPIVDEMSELLADIQKRHRGHPIGVVGMCLTGSVPLGMVRNPDLKAIVLSQPALPVAIGRSKGRIGLSRAEIDAVKNRSDLQILLTAFSSDCISPPERLRAFATELGDQVRVVPARTGNPQFHAVLTDASAHPEAQRALDEVLAYLSDRLLEPRR
jgi:dienelactone hydrolase